MSATPDLREAIARTLADFAGFDVGEGDYLCADALLSGPLANMKAEIEASKNTIKFWTSQVDSLIALPRQLQNKITELEDQLLEQS